MLIALISDIHGNLSALNAVLEDTDKAGAEQTWCMGDLVGYVPFPNECIELTRNKASESIVGNYDLKVIDFKKKKSEWKKSKKTAKFDAFEWNNRHLNPRSQKYLRSLPRDIRLETGKFKILLTHGSPQYIDEPIYFDTPQERFIELGKIADTEIIVCGHTHQFMNRKVGNQWFKNDLRASYALMDISQDKIKVTERNIQYDVSEVIRSMQEANLSDTLIKKLKLEYEIDLKKPPLVFFDSQQDT